MLFFLVVGPPAWARGGDWFFADGLVHGVGGGGRHREWRGPRRGGRSGRWFEIRDVVTAEGKTFPCSRVEYGDKRNFGKVEAFSEKRLMPMRTSNSPRRKFTKNLECAVKGFHFGVEIAAAARPIFRRNIRLDLRPCVFL